MKLFNGNQTLFAFLCICFTNNYFIFHVSNADDAVGGVSFPFALSARPRSTDFFALFPPLPPLSWRRFAGIKMLSECSSRISLKVGSMIFHKHKFCVGVPGFGLRSLVCLLFHRQVSFFFLCVCGFFLFMVIHPPSIV